MSAELAGNSWKVLEILRASGSYIGQQVLVFTYNQAHLCVGSACSTLGTSLVVYSSIHQDINMAVYLPHLFRPWAAMKTPSSRSACVSCGGRRIEWGDSGTRRSR